MIRTRGNPQSPTHCRPSFCHRSYILVPLGWLLKAIWIWLADKFLVGMARLKVSPLSELERGGTEMQQIRTHNQLLWDLWKATLTKVHSQSWLKLYFISREITIVLHPKLAGCGEVWCASTWHMTAWLRSFNYMAKRWVCSTPDPDHLIASCFYLAGISSAVLSQKSAH